MYTFSFDSIKRSKVDFKNIKLFDKGAERKLKLGGINSERPSSLFKRSNPRKLQKLKL